MGIRSTMASMPSKGDVWKISMIQRVVLCCIFFSSDRFFKIGAFLKNYSGNLYNTIGSTYVL